MAFTEYVLYSQVNKNVHTQLAVPVSLAVFVYNYNPIQSKVKKVE